MKIAIQGEPGSFHHEAAMRYFGVNTAILPCDSFSEVFGVLNRHDADIALVAIENSLYGSINEVYDLIESHRYPIVGEVYLRVEQQLIALPGTKLADITSIYSHPVALAQCEHFIESNLPNARAVSFHDTAAAVEYIQQQQKNDSAAIASRAAAELHGLPILQESIEDNPSNYTRFVVVSRSPQPETETADKASLVLETNHQPGALSKVLALFAARNINMTKLQSRPIIGEAWTYRFYIDIEVSPAILRTLTPEIKSLNTKLYILGSYKSGR